MVCYGSCSRSKMLPPVWSLQPASLTTSNLCFVACTGFRFVSELLSRSRSWCINAYTGLHHRISLSSVNPFPASLADSVYDLLLVARCSFQEPEQSLVRAASLSRALLSGMAYLPTYGLPTSRPQSSQPVLRLTCLTACDGCLQRI
jgi:hypothetical protein